MSAALRRLGDRLAVAACAAGISAALGLCAGTALAADYEVRLPVNKTVRMLPVSEAENATNAATSPAASAAVSPARPAAPSPAVKPPVKASAKPSAKPAAKPSPKPAAKQAKPAARPARQVEPSGGVRAGTESVKPEHEPKAGKKAARHAAAAPAEAGTAAAESAAPQAAKKPAASKALAVEGAGKPGETISTGALGALPADGLWVGEVAVSIEKRSVVVRADTNKKADHVTWFNQTDPRKLAIDLRGQWRSKSRERVLRFAAGPVKNLVVGQHEDRVRLSVEFREASVAPDVTPQVEPQSAGLVVTIPLATEAKP